MQGVAITRILLENIFHLLPSLFFLFSMNEAVHQNKVFTTAIQKQHLSDCCTDCDSFNAAIV